MKKPKQLLIDISTSPLKRTTDRYKTLGWNPRKGNEIKDKLLKKGFIEPVDINTGKGRIRLYEITPLGKQFLQETGNSVINSPRNGGLEHQYWVSNVKSRFEAEGYQVQEEFPINPGKAIDLVATHNSLQIAIEIETGKSNVGMNISKCLEADYDLVLVVATKREVKQDLLRKYFASDPRVIILTGSKLKVEELWRTVKLI